MSPDFDNPTGWDALDEAGAQEKARAVARSVKRIASAWGCGEPGWGGDVDSRDDEHLPPLRWTPQKPDEGGDAEGEG